MVTIYGDAYKLRTDDDPAYLRKLADMVDERMTKMGEKSLSFSPKELAVMAALSIADEYMKLKQEYDEVLELLEEE